MDGPVSNPAHSDTEQLSNAAKPELVGRPDSLHSLGCVGLVLTVKDVSAFCPEVPGKRLWVKRVLPDSPAALHGGIKVGLEVTRVCGSDARSRIQQGEALSTIAADFLGEPGTPCSIRFLDHAEDHEFDAILTRWPRTSSSCAQARGPAVLVDSMYQVQLATESMFQLATESMFGLSRPYSVQCPRPAPRGSLGAHTYIQPYIHAQNVHTYAHPSIHPSIHPSMQTSTRTNT